MWPFKDSEDSKEAKIEKLEAELETNKAKYDSLVSKYVKLDITLSDTDLDSLKELKDKAAESDRYRRWWHEEYTKTARLESLLEEANSTIREANRRIATIRSERSTISKINWFVNSEGRDIKRRYRSLSNIFHPDKGGDVSIMTEINNQYSKVGK